MKPKYTFWKGGAMIRRNRSLEVFCVLLAFAIIVSNFCPVHVAAKSKAGPKLSVANGSLLRIKDEKNYTIKLTGAGKSKVTWKVSKDKYCVQSALKIVKKDKKKLVLKPVANGYGTITCTVGKKKLSCSYTVFLMNKTSKQYAKEDEENLFDAVLAGKVPVLTNLCTAPSEKSLPKNGQIWRFLTEDQPGGTWVESFYNDMDNDDVFEVAIKGKGTVAGYGGMYLDAQDGLAYIMARGSKDGGSLTNFEYNDLSWIAYQDIFHPGYQSFVLNRYEGFKDGTPAETITIRADYTDNNKGGYDKDSHFYYNGKSITYEEFEAYIADMGLHAYKAGEAMPTGEDEEDNFDSEDDQEDLFE
jgi:hypothetical protein